MIIDQGANQEPWIKTCVKIIKSNGDSGRSSHGEAMVIAEFDRISSDRYGILYVGDIYDVFMILARGSDHELWDYHVRA